jgi:APA family basic amino acid/polyamine antiporter
MAKDSGQPKMKHELGLLDGTMLVAGSMIGSGIFIVVPTLYVMLARQVG